jgi:hypothetical protein
MKKWPKQIQETNDNGRVRFQSHHKDAYSVDSTKYDLTQPHNRSITPKSHKKLSLRTHSRAEKQIFIIPVR